ncbi:MAG: sorbosone dehydrogenase family protein [Bacteriovoracaceae bacterium]|nr:sorbosone dehydrogenase family protein [Bacteriovoracaceae bacterium]
MRPLIYFSVVLFRLFYGALFADTLSSIQLPPGFSISIFAEGLDKPREMALGNKGTVFVGSMDDKVYALTFDPHSPQKAKEKYIMAQNLNTPNGVAFVGEDLFIAEISQIDKLAAIESNLTHPTKLQIVNATYPKDEQHGWKYIALGPDGWLYIPIGAPCNVCKPKDPYATITRMKLDGSKKEIYARGIRNTVGFDWDPLTKQLWFTDNGRDMLGDNTPPDELNHAPKAGMNFGYPYCHGKSVSDPEFGKEHSCSEFTPPAIELGPHVASLGMLFYQGKIFPAEYQNQIFIAEHGSWNRTRPIGYRVSLVKLDSKRNPTNYSVFASGWLSPDEKVSGRPVALLMLPDGSLLVSDDYGGRIYRITYSK